MTLDETCDDMAYVLGRIFAVLENIQHAATGATTVKDKYFNSACAMPATIFPLLLRLESSHIRVLRRDKKALANNLENKLTELMRRIKSEFPKHLPILEQGLFYLGYFYQKENRYDKDVQEG